MLYRTNAQSRVVEEAMMRLGVPYKVVGGTRFYDRREVKDAMAYLRAVVNPADEVSVKRILNVPKRGVGDASLAKLDTYAATAGVGFLDALRQAPEAGVSGPAARGIDSFVALVDRLNELAAGDDVSPGDLLNAALEDSGYLAELEAEDTVESAGRLENLAELVGSAREFTRIEEFLEQVSLVADTDDISDDDQVVLMTLHSAKGLEFPVVFLVGVEEGVFPHTRALTEPDELEEERRLAYVGITRARERLFITHAVEPQPLRHDAVQPAVTVPRRDPGRAGRVEGQRQRPQRVRPPEPAPSWLRPQPAPVPAATRRRRRRRPPARRRAPRAGGRSRAAGRPADGAGAERRPRPRAAHRRRRRAPCVRRGRHHRPPRSGRGRRGDVNFPGVGTKHLALAWAPLKKR